MRMSEELNTAPEAEVEETPAAEEATPEEAPEEEAPVEPAPENVVDGAAVAAEVEPGREAGNPEIV